MPGSHFLGSSNHSMIEQLDQRDQSPAYWMGGEEMQSAVLPLMLLKPKIEETLYLLMSQRPGQESLSSHDALWIRDELKSLLAKCHESAAADLRQQSHDMTSRTNSNGPTEGTTEIGGQKYKEKNESSKEKKITSTSCVLQESPTGKISVRLQFTRNIKSGETTISDVLFLLAPTPSISRDGVFVSLSRLNGTFKQPNIQRSMSTYTVVEPNSPGFECVRLNDIQKLRVLLKTKQVNPSIRNTENESILSVSSSENECIFCPLILSSLRPDSSASTYVSCSSMKGQIQIIVAGMPI